MRLVLTSVAALVFGTAASAVTVINGNFESDLNAAVLYATPDTSSALLQQAVPLSLAVGRYSAAAWRTSAVSGRARATRAYCFRRRCGRHRPAHRRLRGRPALPVELRRIGRSRQPRGTTRLYYSASGGDPAMFDFTANSSTARGVQYSHVSYDFVASGKSQQIGFFGIDDQFGPVLDNVSISAIPRACDLGADGLPVSPLPAR